MQLARPSYVPATPPAPEPMHTQQETLVETPPASPPLNLRGHRFAPLTYEAMSAEQRSMTDQVLAGQRASMQGPYNVFLRSPQMGQLAQQFGAHTRFHSSLPLKLNELAILLVARFWRCEFVWWAHARIALDNGLAPTVVQAICADQPPPELAADEALVYAFASELLAQRRVSDDTYTALVARFAERGAVDLMGTMSYYALVSMALNVDEYPLPDGAVPVFTDV